MNIWQIVVKTLFVTGPKAGPGRRVRRAGGYTVLAADDGGWLARLGRAAGARGYTVPQIRTRGGGGGGFVAGDRLILEGGGSGEGGDMRTAAGLVSLGRGQGAFTLGASMVEARGVRLFPYVGFGGGGMGTSVTAPDGTIRGVGLGQLHLLAGVGADLWLRFGGFGLLLGVRVDLVAAPLQRATEPLPRVAGGRFLRVVAGWEKWAA
jgi:hypothetical protein